MRTLNIARFTLQEAVSRRLILASTGTSSDPIGASGVVDDGPP